MLPHYYDCFGDELSRVEDWSGGSQKVGPLVQKPAIKHLFPTKFLLTAVDRLKCLGVEISRVFDSSIRVG